MNSGRSPRAGLPGRKRWQNARFVHSPCTSASLQPPRAVVKPSDFNEFAMASGCSREVSRGPRGGCQTVLGGGFHHPTMGGTGVDLGTVVGVGKAVLSSPKSGEGVPLTL